MRDTTRWRRAARFLPAPVVVLLVASVVGALVVDGRPSRPDGRVLVADVGDVAIAVGPDGSLLFGERRSGAVSRADAGGAGEPTPLVTVAVSSDGAGRGLLGLTVDDEGAVVAAWTDTTPQRRLVVGRVHPGPVEIRWVGPASAPARNGGSLASAYRGIVLAVGDRGGPPRPGDAEPHGTLLRFPGPEFVSGGWEHPFGFAVTPSGDLWIADDRRGEAPDVLARGDTGRPEVATVLPPGTAPSGLAARSDEELLVCGGGTGHLLRYLVAPDGRARPDGRVADDCRRSVVALPGGRIAYATTSGDIAVLDLALPRRGDDDSRAAPAPRNLLHEARHDAPSATGTRGVRDRRRPSLPSPAWR